MPKKKSVAFHIEKVESIEIEIIEPISTENIDIINNTSNEYPSMRNMPKVFNNNLYNNSRLISS